MTRRERHVGAVVALALVGCHGHTDRCRDRIVDRVSDPTQTRLATVFTRDCGTTTRTITAVAIGQPGDDPTRATIFTADTNDDPALQDGPALWVRPIWTDATTLVVSYRRGARLFRSMARVGPITIRYRATEPIYYPPVP